MHHLPRSSKRSSDHISCSKRSSHRYGSEIFSNEKHDDKSGISSGAATASDAAVVVVALLLGLC